MAVSMMSFMGFWQMFFLWGFGGIGLPLGLPPGPEDPVMANIAPQECLFYMSWAGMAKPDPNSKNQLEQLFAEPDVQNFAGEVERRIRGSLKAAAQREGPEAVAMIDEVIDLVKTALTSPAAIYLAKVGMGPAGPDVRAGVVINLGADAAKVRSTLEKYQQRFLGSLPEAKAAEPGAEGWHLIQPGPRGPAITWGVRGKYLIAVLGDGEADDVLKRGRGNPPEWLTSIRQQLPVPRRATLAYTNLKGVIAMVQATAGPQAATVIKALGLDSITSLASVTGLDETGFVSKSLVRIEGESEGLLAAVSNKPLEAKDLAPIPQDATFAVAARIDVSQVWQTIVAMIGKIDPRGGERFAEELGMVEERLGFKIRDDLLAPLGDVWCLYNSPGEGGLVVTGLTAVVSLKDAKRAAATHEKLIALVKAAVYGAPPDLVPRIEEFQFAGRQVYSLNVPDAEFPVAPSWCLTDKELIVALFPQNVKAYLARGADFQSLAAAPEVAEVLKAESGPIMLSYQNAPELFRLLYPVLQIAAKYALRELQREGIDVDISVLPAASSIGKHLRPGVSVVRRTKEGIETTTRQTLPSASIGTTGPVAVALLLPAVQGSREARRRSQCANNLKQIALAMHNYHDVNKTFPPAYTVDKNGKPLLSWRVLILPYMEQQALYQQFHLDEPWDSEHNKKLAQVMVPTYHCPSTPLVPGKTTYLTVRHKDAIFAGDEAIGFAGIRDGSSNTILVVEAGFQAAVPWTKPDDFVPDPNFPTRGLGGYHPGGFNVAMADGSVRFISQRIDPKTLWALFTRAGGEVVTIDQTYGPPSSYRRPAVPVPKVLDFRSDPEYMPQPLPPGAIAPPALPPGVGMPISPIERARMAARRAQSTNNLKQIAIALHNYHDVYKVFPAASYPDKTGKPRLSWRVAILPYVEESQLYKEFNFNEPWDSEHNKKLIERIPQVYRSPASKAGPGKTNYLTVRGERTVFPGPGKNVGFAQITDGTSNTIMTVEASDQRAVIWTKPDDFEYDPKDPLKGLVGLYPDGFLAGLADASVLFLSAKADPQTLLLAFDRADGKPISIEQLTIPPVGSAVPSFFGPEVKRKTPLPVRPAPKKTAAGPAGGPGGLLGSYSAAQRRAQVAAARAQISALQGPLDMYSMDLRDYPSTKQGLQALVNAPKDLANQAGWSGPYLKQAVPLDPWGRAYQYEYPSKHGLERPDIWSLGPDGESGTDDDITNWAE